MFKAKNKGTTMQDLQEHDFGIFPGQIVKMKAVGSISHGVVPWDGETYVVKITEEYPWILSGIVYPHKYRDRHNISDQFNISISKVDIWVGDIKVTK